MKYIANPVEVDAYRITEVGASAPCGGIYVAIDRDRDSIVLATNDMIARMTPKVGDYWVIQADGYVYLNPKDVFERKYSPKKQLKS